MVPLIATLCITLPNIKHKHTIVNFSKQRFYILCCSLYDTPIGKECLEYSTPRHISKAMGTCKPFPLIIE